MISNILIRYNIQSYIYIHLCLRLCVGVCRYYTCGHVAGFCGEVCPRIRSSSTLRRGATGGMGWNIPNGCLRKNLHRKPCFLEYVYIYMWVSCTFSHQLCETMWNMLEFGSTNHKKSRVKPGSLARRGGAFEVDPLILPWLHWAEVLPSGFVYTLWLWLT
jgi:hypothetical protein